MQVNRFPTLSANKCVNKSAIYVVRPPGTFEGIFDVKQIWLLQLQSKIDASIKPRKLDKSISKLF